VINIAHYIDHTILKPTTTHMEIKKICEEAVQYGFAAVCIPPSLVTLARLQRVPRIATVIGFPFGYSVIGAKLAETEQALKDGADELDVVINLTALRAGDWNYLDKEMTAVAGLIHEGGKVVKVIIESGILTNEEIVRCCEVYSKVGVDFVKTSTGYAEKGASVEAVRLMRQHLPQRVKIKASGGIRTYDLARQLIEAGADRLGCSASVEIVKGETAAAGGY
jgi:deoxyribose-phosphate aldolase